MPFLFEFNGILNQHPRSKLLFYRYQTSDKTPYRLFETTLNTQLIQRTTETCVLYGIRCVKKIVCFLYPDMYYRDRDKIVYQAKSLIKRERFYIIYFYFTSVFICIYVLTLYQCAHCSIQTTLAPPPNTTATHTFYIIINVLFQLLMMSPGAILPFA